MGFGLTLAGAQTVTVSTDGTADFDNVQDALASFTPDPDPGEPNVIQIVDDGTYEGHVLIDFAVTIEGTDTNRPTLLLQSATSAHGIAISIADESTVHDVTLRNLILLPSETDTATRAINAGGANMNLLLENLLLCPQDGSGNPVTTDGLTELDLLDFPDRVEFGDDGMLVGGGGPAGTGSTITFRDVVISHFQVGTSPDGIILSAGQTGTNYVFEDGNVISYCGRFGIQAGRNLSVNAPNERLLLIGNGNSNLWYTGSDGTVDDVVIDGVVSVGSQQSGFLHQVGGAPQNLIVRNSIFAGNALAGIRVGAAAASDDSHTVTFENVTSARNGEQAFDIFNIAYEAPVTVLNSILAGNGTDDAGNVVRNFGSGTLSIENSAIVENGPDRLNTTPIEDPDSLTTTFAIVAADPAFDPTDDPTAEDYFQVSNTTDYAGGEAGGDFLRGGAPAPFVEPTPTPEPTPEPLQNESFDLYR